MHTHYQFLKEMKEALVEEGFWLASSQLSEEGRIGLIQW